jgi:hypothetical protein
MNPEGIGLSFRPARARICKAFKEPRNRFPARQAGTTTQFVERARQLQRLAESIPESIPRNRFLDSLSVYKYGLWLHWLAESIP